MSARLPAFPEPWQNTGDRNETAPDGQIVPPGYTVLMAGMTLRDYFAAKALAVLIDVDDMDLSQDRDDFAAECAEGAYAYADAMLKARN